LLWSVDASPLVRPPATEARDGSLFDLKRDSIGAIADASVGNVTPGRVEISLVAF